MFSMIVKVQENLNLIYGCSGNLLIEWLSRVNLNIDTIPMK
jgi:hypothetical protein